MKTALGLILTLAGAALIVAGIARGVLPLIDVYRNNLTDPLGQPEGAEEKVGPAMRRGVILGACGVPPFIIGSVLLKVTMVQRIARAASGKPKDPRAR